MTLDEARIPVVAGVGQVVERGGAAGALELAARAVDRALDEAPGLRRRVQQVSVVNILSPVGPAPAASLARTCGLTPTRTEVTTIGGNSPQWLVSRAADAIAAGELDTVVVAGAEALSPARGGRSAGPDDPAHQGTPGGPDPVVGSDRPGVGQVELDAGLVAPVHVYALFESVIAHRAGRTPAEHRVALGELMAPLTEVAATHPVAWYPQVVGADRLARITPDNRLVAEPYPKRMCAVMAVDQGAAVVVTSLASARAAGAAGGAVFCWSGADATDVWFPSARPDLGSSPGIAAATGAALGAAGLGTGDIALFDLYSCFPSALEMAVEALGLDRRDPRRLTVTGGLPYFGGPGNNYSLHAVATAVDRLRHQGGTALVSALGWYVTKHAVGVYGAAPPTRGWRRGDTGAAQRSIDASALAVAAGAEGPAVVDAATVVVGRDGAATAAPVIGRLGDGRRVVAGAEPDELAAVAETDLVGARVWVAGTPSRYRVVSVPG